MTALRQREAGRTVVDQEELKQVERANEAEEVEERSSPRGEIVYEAIRKEGEHELNRSTSALAWSGLAAGLSMGFSFLVPALIHSHLPDEGWRPLLVNFGYSIGFLIVILGRQQLFTENTLTVVLPLLQNKDEDTFVNMMRLWATVFLSNLVGAILFAFVVAKTELVGAGVHHAMRDLATQSMDGSFLVIALRGIFAGWLIAMMVWLLPFAETARVGVIIIVTYVVGIAGFSHVIAGSVDAAYLAMTHQRTWMEFLVGFTLPALIGNIIGGVSLVAAIGHAQLVSGEE